MLTLASITTSYYAALLMGFFSSMHCIGMCGSIIGTLTFSLDQKVRQNKARLWQFIFNYNLGRIFSYALAGGLAGLLSSSLNISFDQSLGHRTLQLLSALFMASAGLYIAGWFPRFAYIEKLGMRFWKILEPYGHKLIPVKTRLHAFLFGMIWGWLPCGLVYTALMLAASTGDGIKSSLTMLAFGVGTLPAVISTGIMTQSLNKFAKQANYRKIVGILMILLACVAAFPWLYPLRFQHHAM